MLDCSLPYSLCALCCRLFCLTGLFTAPAASAYQGVPIDDGIYRNLDPALGINVVFGRWNTVVPLVYDPDGAPAVYADDAHFLALLEEALHVWERVSGVRFRIVGVDRSALDDFMSPRDLQDQLVRVSWIQDGGFAGRAGPVFDYYDEALGYAPYRDGELELNATVGSIHSDTHLLEVLVHELGHLLGLGHSDNPASVMFANPYNFLRYPREDDIRAVQTLYGPAQPAIDPSQPLAQWQYDPSPAADGFATRHLFTSNQQTSAGAHFALSNGTVIGGITDEAPDELFVRLHAGGVGNFSNHVDIDLDAEVFIVDPFGYVQKNFDWNLKCQAYFACGGAWVSIAPARVMKTLPGNWQVHVVDKDSDTTLLSLALPVLASEVYNKAPVVTVAAEQGDTPSAVRFTIAATDAEEDEILTRWHPPRPYEQTSAMDTIQAPDANGLFAKTVDFGVPGRHQFFVELVDSGPRYESEAPGYGNAGKGFKSLLRITVNLPFIGAADDLEVAATQAEDPEFGGSGSSPAPTPEVLSLVADTLSMNHVITSNGSPTTAAFTLGASRDQGLSTQTLFSSRDALVIAGTALVQQDDIESAGSIFLVIRSVTSDGEIWRYRDATGTYTTWDNRLVNLQPAYVSTALPPSTLVEVYSGKLPAGNHNVFIGYRRTGSNILHYTSEALRLRVSD